jgi:ornithine lipid ester-linked acyl 2-hydroxylase
VLRRLRRLEKDLFSGLAWPLERWITAGSLVGTTPVLGRGDAPWLGLLEVAAPAIRDEFLALEKAYRLPNFGDISRDQRGIGGAHGWKVLFLYGAGYRDDDVCARCPITAQVLEALPNMVNAMFSWLEPGKHVLPHRGLFRGLVRAHLGLEVPVDADQCWMRVGDRVVRWEVGKAFAFDDTFEHEVKNETAQRRVVLIVDVERPMRLPQRLFTKALIQAFRRTRYVQSARENQRKLTSAVRGQ